MALPLAAVLAATLCTWKPAAIGDPLHRFFSGAKVECREAKAGTLARERLNVFVRGDDRIGVDVALTDHIDEAELKLMLERARPAARLKVHGLAEGDSLFAYVPETEVAIPLVVDGDVALVPADTTVILISTPSPTGRRCREAADEGPCKSEIARTDAPHPASGHPLPVGEGFTGVSAPARAEDGEATLTNRALIGWVESRLPKTGAPKSKPIVMLDGKRKPDASASILIFHEIGGDKHELTLRGDGWKSQTVAVEMSGLTVMKTPLIATPSRNLTVRWTLLQDPATLAPKESECDAKERPKVSGPMTMALLDCPGMQPNAWYMSVNVGRCREAATVTLPPDERHGRAELHDLAGGPYLLRFRRTALPDLWKSIVVPDDRDGDVQADVEYVRLFGTITRGKKNVRATMKVIGGETISDEDGRYELTLNESRVPKMFTLVPCDTGEDYLHVVDERPAPNARFDIDIPDNVLKVDVVDDENGQPIANARISFGLLENGDSGDEGGAWYAGDLGKTDERGTFVVKQTEKTHRAHVCAYREDYERKCAEAFRFEEQAEVSLRLALKKVEMRTGHMHVAGAVEAGVMIWHSRDGIRVEQSRVKEDGSFTFTKPHAPGEIVTFASSSHPLYVFLQGPSFELTLPAAPVHTFEVSLDPSSQGEVVFYSLLIGDVPVPSSSMSAYGLRHGGSRASVQRGGTDMIRDVLATGPIQIVVMPLTFLQANGNLQRDLALHPAARSLPHFPVGNETRVIVNDH